MNETNKQNKLIIKQLDVVITHNNKIKNQHVERRQTMDLKNIDNYNSVLCSCSTVLF